MRKTLLALLFLAATQLNATHILSGHFTYEYVSSSGNQKTYEINLYLFRDVNGINMPSTATVYYKKSNQSGNGTSLTLTQVGTGSTGAVTCSSNLNYDVHHYQATVTLDAGSAYDIAYSTCCRPWGVDNISNASSQSIYLTTKVVTSRGDVRNYNNSVEFDNVVFSAPVNKTVPFQLAMADPDGDSLSFQVTTLKGGSANTLTPTNLTYNTGYSNSAPFGTTGTFAIDSANRIMIAKSGIQQRATINIRVIEWAKDTLGTFKIMGITEKEFFFTFTGGTTTGTISATAASGNFGSDTVYVSTNENVYPYFANFDSTQIVLVDPNGDTNDYVLGATAMSSYQDFYLNTTAFLIPGNWTLHFAMNEDSMSVVGACGKPLIDSISFFVVPPIIQIAGPTDSVYGADPVTYTLQYTTYVDSVAWSTTNGTIQAAYSKDSVTVQWGTTGNGPASLTAIGWTYGTPDTVSISVSVHGIGIEESTLLSGAYPNPVKDYFYLNSTETLEVKLVDYVGRTYLEAQASQRVDLSQIPNGKYILMVSSASRTDRVPLVIAH